MGCIILSSVTRLAEPYFFSNYLKTARYSEKKITEDKMCALVSSTTFAGNISHSKNYFSKISS